jgi:hypothetical protein
MREFGDRLNWRNAHQYDDVRRRITTPVAAPANSRGAAEANALGPSGPG